MLIAPADAESMRAVRDATCSAIDDGGRAAGGAAVSEAKVLVTDVAEGCAASGLVRRGDRLLTINGVKVADEQQGTALAKAALGNVAYYILRGEELVTVTAHKPQAATRLGVTIKNLTDDQQAQARGAAQRAVARTAAAAEAAKAAEAKVVETVEVATEAQAVADPLGMAAVVVMALVTVEVKPQSVNYGDRCNTVLNLPG